MQTLQWKKQVVLHILSECECVCECVCVCVCVCVVLGIEHAMRMQRIVICGLPRCTLFFAIIS